tara:strand:+ start:4413 stop:5135 length:723 start_codon:yes stop_codon:yes gene_type:complete
MLKNIFEGLVPILKEEADYGWQATLPELPGITSTSKSEGYAVAVIRLLYNFKNYKEKCKKTNQKIPIPISEKEFSGQFNIRINPNLHKALALEASQNKISLNELISKKLEKTTHSKRNVYEWQLEGIEMPLCFDVILRFSEYGGKKVFLLFKEENLADELGDEFIGTKDNLLNKIKSDRELMNIFQSFLSELVLVNDRTEQKCVLIKKGSLNEATRALNLPKLNLTEDEKYLLLKREINY